MKTYFLLCFVLLSLAVKAQDISGVVNTYAPVTAIEGDCPTEVTIGAILPSRAHPFEAGDLVMLIQMQDATIDYDAASDPASLGVVTNLNSTGLYEYARIASISGSVITLANPLVNTYHPNSTTSRLQIIRVPEYTSPTVTGLLNSYPWDNNCGGVIVLHATGTITIDAGGSIRTDAEGFLGGVHVNDPNSVTCAVSNNFLATGSSRGARKGEGIWINSTTREGRGAAANGGGGGNEHNAGGGGGANGGVGGVGGDGYSGNVCDGVNDNQLRGMGGNSLAYAVPANRVFLGGGGGAGHANNASTATGGKGGGIIFVTANTIVNNSTSTTGVITANGEAGLNTNDDGAGGGGAGGAIVLDVNNYPNPIDVWANGGNGGNSAGAVWDFGPGGGGGGGAIISLSAVMPAAISGSVAGGQPGHVLVATNNYGAVEGLPGVILSGAVASYGCALGNQLEDFGYTAIGQAEVSAYGTGTTVLWPNKVYVYEDIVITDVTIDITTSDVVFAQGAGIVFAGSAHLRATNSVFRPCDEQGSWDGLLFSESSDGQINNNTFKNAQQAVAVASNASDGVTIDNNLFKNCAVGVTISLMVYEKGISGNTFFIDNDYPVSLRSFLSGDARGIWLTNAVCNKLITQNDFIGNRTCSLNPFFGVFSHNSDADVSKNNFSNVFRCLDVNGVPTYFDFSNNEISYVEGDFPHSTGIHAVNVGSIDEGTVYIANNAFSYDHSPNEEEFAPIDVSAIFCENTSGGLIVGNEISGFTIAIHFDEVANSNIIDNEIVEFNEQGIYTELSQDVGIALNELDALGIFRDNLVGMQFIEPIGNMVVVKNKIYMNALLDEFVGPNPTVCTGIQYSKDIDDGFTAAAYDHVIEENCIFETLTSLFLEGGGGHANSIPYIRNNYFYNYTDFGLLNQDYIGDGFSAALGDVGNILSPGRNSFVSNYLPTGAVDVSSPTNNIWLVNNSSNLVTLGFVNINNVNDVMTSNSSCGNQIGNDEIEKTDETSNNLSELQIPKTTTEIIEAYYPLKRQQDEYRLLAGYMDSILAFKSDKYKYCLFIMAKLAQNDDKAMFNSFYNAIIAADLFNSADDLSKFKIQYLIAKGDVPAAIMQLDAVTMQGGDLGDWAVVTKAELLLGQTHYDINALNADDVELLKNLARGTYRYTSEARNLLQSSIGGYDHNFATAKSPVPTPKYQDAIVTSGRTIEIFPNPFNDQFQVLYRLEEERVNPEIIVTDITGREITRLSLANATGLIDVSLGGQPSGVYLVTLMNNGAKFSVNKVIKY